jgi:CRISPR/Cas system endoribonuclease Cas6 (RAMP superfamily)
MARKKHRTKLEKVMTEKYELTYEVSVEDCQKWFNILNRELFNNTLPKIDEIDIRWRRGAHAWYDYDDRHPGTGITKLLMSRKYKSKKFFVEVLAHEMVHHYQYIYNEEMGHGSSFFKWRDKFNKKGLNLVRAY